MKTTPSGMVVEVRGLTGKDGRYLADERLVRDNEVEDYILTNCIASVAEPGVYAFDANKPDWDKVLIGDRVWLMLAIRVASYPDEPLPCPCKCTTCKKRFVWDVDVGELLADKTQPLEDADREVVRRGERFTIKLSTGHELTYKLKTGGDRKRFIAWRDSLVNANKKKRERRNDFVNGFLLWGSDITGIDRKASDAKQDFLESLSLRELNAIRQEMELHDCGVDTTIKAECPHCGAEMEFQLPFDRSFFIPDTSEKKKTLGDMAREKKADEEADDANAS